VGSDFGRNDKVTRKGKEKREKRKEKVDLSNKEGV